MAKKYTKLYYSITEVGKLLELKPHILRYWETEFPILHPKKNRAGNRAYRKKDIDIAQTIKFLLYTEGYTIEGARKKILWLKEQDIDIRTYSKAAADQPRPELPEVVGLLREVREGLKEMKQVLASSEL